VDCARFDEAMDAGLTWIGERARLFVVRSGFFLRITERTVLWRDSRETESRAGEGGRECLNGVGGSQAGTHSQRRAQFAKCTFCTTHSSTSTSSLAVTRSLSVTPRPRFTACACSPPTPWLRAASSGMNTRTTLAKGCLNSDRLAYTGTL